MIPLLPRFRAGEAELTGASRGSAYHRVMELLDLTAAYDADSLAGAIAAMEGRGQIDRAMAACVRPADILAFVRSGSGQRMREAAKRGLLFREQPFVIGVDMRDVYPDCGDSEDDRILVQGIIDVWFERRTALSCWTTRRTRSGRRISSRRSTTRSWTTMPGRWSSFLKSR